MTIWQALALGVVQGLTEFLPVSSSGHLALFQAWFGLAEPLVSFAVLLHVATLLAVIVFFWRDLWSLSWRQWLVLAVSSIPAGLAGFFLSTWADQLFSTLSLVGLFWLVTGVFNLLAGRKLKNAEDLQRKQISFKSGFLIGLFQALALLPGISRSGATVFAGLQQGLKRVEAFKFSFLLSVPAIVGATGLQALELSAHGWQSLLSWSSVLGAMMAFVVGLMSLYLFELVMKKANLSYFGYYCLLLAVVVELGTIL